MTHSAQVFDKNVLEKVKVEISNPTTITAALKQLFTIFAISDENCIFASNENIIPLLKSVLISKENNYSNAYSASRCIKKLSLVLGLEATLVENLLLDLISIIKDPELMNNTDKVSSAFMLYNNALAILGNICTVKASAVKSMLYDSIPTLIAVIYKNLSIASMEDRLKYVLLATSTHLISSTVRDLISQILLQHLKEFIDITNLCRSDNLTIAFSSALIVSYLSLNEDNVPTLRGCKVFENLSAFNEKNPLGNYKDTFVITPKEFEDGYLVLFASPFIEVITFNLWLFARFSCGIKEITFSSSDSVPQYIRQHLLLQIRAYYHHPNKRTRELANLILSNIGDNEFLSVLESVPCWVKSLNIQDLKVTIINKLKQEDITLDKLLNPKIDKIELITILNSLGFLKGTILLMIASLTKEREENENAIKQLIKMTCEINAKERKLAVYDMTLKSENLSNDLNLLNKKKSIFISYSWYNKSSVKKLYSILLEKGFNCWIDECSMQAGAQLFSEIESGISDCQVFIACCSNNYSSSENCQRELLLAAARKKLIIPILVGPTEPWPPKGQMGPLLAGKIYIDLFIDEKFGKSVEQLITAISQSLA
jgi:hypothetical protein